MLRQILAVQLIFQTVIGEDDMKIETKVKTESKSIAMIIL